MQPPEIDFLHDEDNKIISRPEKTRAAVLVDINQKSGLEKYGLNLLRTQPERRIFIHIGED